MGLWSRLLPWVRTFATKLPTAAKVGVFRVVGIGDRGWLSYILLTTVVFLPVLGAVQSAGVVGGLTFLTETLGTSTLSLVDAVRSLPSAGGLEFVWGWPPGVNWAYASVLWSFLYAAATVLWFYRGLHFLWIFFFGSDESRLKTIIVFLFLYIPLVYAYTGGLPFLGPDTVAAFVDSLPFTDGAVNATPLE